MRPLHTTLLCAFTLCASSLAFSSPGRGSTGFLCRRLRRGKPCIENSPQATTSLDMLSGSALFNTDSFLLQGDGATLQGEVSKLLERCGAVSPSALVVFSLGVKEEKVADAVRRAGVVSCPVYIVDSYGIVGYDEAEGRNLELMEKGRGKEYGCRGGDGGKGVVVVAFTGAVATHEEPPFPPAFTESPCLAVCDTSGAFGSFASQCPSAYFGGVAKGIVAVEPSGLARKVPFFLLAPETAAMTSMGLSAVTGSVGESVSSLLSQVPKGFAPAGSLAVFPCFTRGINMYGENNVEPREVAGVFPGCRMWGMFAHGELGPSTFTGFVPPADPRQPCTQHSETTVLALHALPLSQ